jgi:hypothetical protein
MRKTFEQWMAAVDVTVQAAVGLSVADLPDAPFMDWFEAGKSVKSAARAVVNSALEG